MRRILALSLAQPVAVLGLAVAFAIAGAIAFWHLPIEAFPELADPQVQVITLFPGHAAEEVERQVTLPVEQQMNGLPGLTRMHSFSLFGLSFVVLTFDDGTDLYFARQQASERLAQVDVPEGVKPTLGPLSTPTGEIYRYTLVGDGYTPMQLRELEDWVMERHLKQVPGVADVVSFGGFVKQYQVQVDPEQLQARGVTLHQVYEALGRSNANAGGNYIEHGEGQYVVRGLGTLAGAGDIEQVVVAARGGIPIRICDLARVTVGAFPRRGVVTRDREPEAVEGIVLMRRGENPSAVLDALHAKIEQLNQVVETAIGGATATALWEGERHFDVVVRLAEASRATLDRLPDIRVATPDGAQVPLAQLARVEVAPGQASITREANMRFVGVRLNVHSRDLGGLVAEAERRVAAEVKLPPNSFLTWGGEFENQRRAMARLAIIIPVSIALILAILFHTFGSLRCALLILATIPFALVGGMVGLDVAGLNLSVSACIGFIALMGQVVLNGVVLVSQINALRAEGLGLRAAVEAGATRRLRAVLMTALLAALGLLPAALSTQIGSETQRPLAVVVIGGLVSATLLTVLVLPVLYTLVLSGRGVRGVPRALGRRDDETLRAAEVA